ncbi:MAG: NFACT RNA binding domain-containing protein [Desulfuromonas sp.]|nr:NFACT RNA binding domain-containing protein [Desulfuromonas sp.]
MNLDYFFIEALVAQLNTELKGALVKKVHQPRAELIVIVLWDGRQEQRLYLSAEVGRVFLGICAFKFRNPMQPPRFSQLLRAHLHRLEEIRVLGYDRQVGLFFTSKDQRRLCLVFDMFGRNTNMFLYAEDRGLWDSMRRVPGSAATVPDDLFALPSSPVLAPDFIFLGATALQSLDENGADPALWLQEHVIPMSRSVARRIGSEIEQQHSLEPLLNFIAAWKDGKLVPEKHGKVFTMWLNNDVATATDTGANIEASVDINEFLNRHLQEPSSEARAFACNPELLSGVDRALKKMRKRGRNIEKELAACAQHEEYGHTAELLDAHRYLLRRGMHEVEVQDYYRDPPENVSIALDPVKTVQENIDAAYNRARKARRGVEHCHRRMQETEQELYWLEEIRQQLSSVDGAGDEELLRAELLEHGYLRSRGKAGVQQRKINPVDLVRTALTPGGFQLVWGRNSKTNAYISRHLLKQDDLWFHAHNTPGCHLVLKTGGREPDAEDIHIAAAVAAYYSAQKQEHSAEVMWTKGKHVKQIKGGRLGMVTVATFSTLHVAPQHEQDMSQKEDLDKSCTPCIAQND